MAARTEASKARVAITRLSGDMVVDSRCPKLGWVCAAVVEGEENERKRPETLLFDEECI